MSVHHGTRFVRGIPQVTMYCKTGNPRITNAGRRRDVTQSITVLGGCIVDVRFTSQRSAEADWAQLCPFEPTWISTFINPLNPDALNAVLTVN